MNHDIPRDKPERLIQKFIATPGSGLTYIRGRRRIGKSFFLKKLGEALGQMSHYFYFVGADDSTTRETQRRFIHEWEQFSEINELSRLKESLHSWSVIFKSITKFAQSSEKLLILAFDEIQWIAKQRSGFIGLLKAEWEEWQRCGNVKVILCGSSSHFFAERTGSEFTILRGLKTFPEIWIEPFSLAVVHENYFPRWSREEVCLVYMMLGGVPYYLQQFKDTDNFIRAVNKVLFTEETIFLDEAREVLKLEFNKAGLDAVLSVLSAVRLTGSTEKNISTMSGVPRSSVYDYIQKLLEYEILGYYSIQGNTSKRYYIRDFFLNCYFYLLQPLRHQIKANESSLIFPHHCLDSRRGYFIQGYSGPAFELLVRTVLESRDISLGIFRRLELVDPNFEVAAYFNPKKSQIDLVCIHEQDREVRLIECKWINSSSAVTPEVLRQITHKQLNILPHYRQSHYLITSQELSEGQLSSAKELGIKCFGIEGLFES